MKILSYLKILFPIALLTLSWIVPAFSLTLISKPIIFDAIRVQLTKDYLQEHYGIKTNSIVMQPKIIVIHWTGTHTLQQAFKEFNSPTLTDRHELPGQLNVSAHFLVDRDGKIYQLMPDNWVARHVIGLNHCAIAIENVGGMNHHNDLTEAQATANALLIMHLKKKFPHIQYVIGHMDYLSMRKSSLWMEKDPHYITQKADPSQKFMRQVREILRYTEGTTVSNSY